MGFHNLPDLGAMLMPGAAEYSQSMLHLAAGSAKSIKHVLDIPYGGDRFQKLDVWMPVCLGNSIRRTISQQPVAKFESAPYACGHSVAAFTRRRAPRVA